VFDMKVLVAYATRHGSTRGIAERIGATLSAEGLAVTVKSVEDAWKLTGYDAFVIGSAAYMGGWLNQAAAFVRRNRSVLAERPVWLFSSGPIGPDKVDKQGRDVLVASEPREFTEFATTIHPRGKRVFFGALDADAEPIGLAERMAHGFTRLAPAVREAMPFGDFRDWPAIDDWARSLARELQQVPVTV
jgi:menaquinone-dependent protoporphyrinogen oxidase